MADNYAPPPNMQVPYDNKDGYPKQEMRAVPVGVPGYSPQKMDDYPGYVPQAGFAPQPGVPYGYPSSSMPPPNQQMPNFQSPGANDTEPIVKGFEFSDESIRRGFIRKVYSILSLQLLVTLGFVTLFSFPVENNRMEAFATENFWVLILALILVLVTIISISCCEGVRRTSPMNIIFLSLFTIGESYMVGCATIQYDKDIVFIAVLLTAVVVVSLTIFAFQTKWDFTMCGGVLFVCLMMMFTVSIIAMFLPHSNTLVLIFSSFGAVLFSCYLVHDTQLIMGGNHKYSISPEEYILGAITLFLDIINIFLYILRILGAATKN